MLDFADKAVKTVAQGASDFFKKSAPDYVRNAHAEGARTVSRFGAASGPGRASRGFGSEILRRGRQVIDMLFPPDEKYNDHSLIDTRPPGPKFKGKPSTELVPYHGDGRDRMKESMDRIKEAKAAALNDEQRKKEQRIADLEKQIRVTSAVPGGGTNNYTPLRSSVPPLEDLMKQMERELAAERKSAQSLRVIPRPTAAPGLPATDAIKPIVPRNLHIPALPDPMALYRAAYKHVSWFRAMADFMGDKDNRYVLGVFSGAAVYSAHRVWNLYRRMPMNPNHMMYDPMYRPIYDGWQEEIAMGLIGGPFGVRWFEAVQERTAVWNVPYHETVWNLLFDDLINLFQPLSEYLEGTVVSRRMLRLTGDQVSEIIPFGSIRWTEPYNWDADERQYVYGVPIAVMNLVMAGYGPILGATATGSFLSDPSLMSALYMLGHMLPWDPAKAVYKMLTVGRASNTIWKAFGRVMEWFAGELPKDSLKPPRPGKTYGGVYYKRKSKVQFGK